MQASPVQLRARYRRLLRFLLPLLIGLFLNIPSATAQESALGSSKDQREAYDAKMAELRERDKVNAMLQEKRDRRNAQLNTDTMTPEVRQAWQRYEEKSYPPGPSGKQQAERDFLMLESNWGAVQAEAHKGTIRPVDATRFSQEHKQAMSVRGNAAAQQVDPSLEVEPMPAQANAKDKPYSDHDGQLRGVVVDDKGTRAPVTAQQAAATRTQFDKNMNDDLRKQGLPELENPSAKMKTDLMLNTDDGGQHQQSAEHQNRHGGTVYQDPVAKDMELKNQKFDQDGVSEAQKSSAMDKARYANEQGRQQDIHRRKQDRELERGLQLVKDNPNPDSPAHKAGLEALQNSQAQGDYGAKYTDRLNKTVDQAANNAKTDHGVDTQVSPNLKASVDKLKKDRTVNATVESATAAATYENNQANKRAEGAQIFAHDGEFEAAAEMARNANASTKGEAIESFRAGAAKRKETELLSSGVSAGEARRQAQSYGDAEAGKMAAAMRNNSKRDVMDPTHDNFKLNSTELGDGSTPEQPSNSAKVFGAAKTGMDAVNALGTGVKATDDYIAGSEAEAMANESQARFDALNKKEVLTKDETDSALAENEETMKQRIKSGKKADGAKGAVAFGGQLGGMVAGEVTEKGSAAVGVALDSYDAGNSAYKASDAYAREQRLRAKAAELSEKGLTEQAEKFTAMADRERETKLTELEKSAGATAKTGLGVAGAAGAGASAAQAGATVASLPAATVIGAAAGAFGSGYGATRAAIDNTKAGKAMEDAKANWIAGKDKEVIANERTALNQHARMKDKFEAALDNGEYTLSEGFDRQSFESAMKTAKESGRYGYVRTMMEKTPIDEAATASNADPQAATVEAVDSLRKVNPKEHYQNSDSNKYRPALTDQRGLTSADGMEDYRDYDPTEKPPAVTDQRVAAKHDAMQDYRNFDPTEHRAAVSDQRVINSVDEMEDYRDFDPTQTATASVDQDLADLVFEMEEGHQQATRQLDAEKRQGKLSRSSDSFERTRATRTAARDTEVIQVASAQAAREAQRSLHEQADRITEVREQRAAEQARRNTADQSVYLPPQQTTLTEVFERGHTATATSPSVAGSSVGGSTSSNALTPACRESNALAQQMAALEPRARAGDKNALSQFQSLAKRAQSVQQSCQQSLVSVPRVTTLPAAAANIDVPSYEGDDCGPVIYGIPKTEEECRKYKAARSK